jgi:hypothetical protein
MVHGSQKFFTEREKLGLCPKTTLKLSKAPKSPNRVHTSQLATWWTYKHSTITAEYKRKQRSKERSREARNGKTNLGNSLGLLLNLARPTLKPSQAYFEPGLAYFDVFSIQNQTPKGQNSSKWSSIKLNFFRYDSNDVYKIFPKDQPLEPSESTQI